MNQELIQIRLANGNALTAQQATSVITPTQPHYYLLHIYVLAVITALKAHNILHSIHVLLEHTTTLLVYVVHLNVNTVLVDITALLQES